MPIVDLDSIVSAHVASFSERRRTAIQELSPAALISRKNPYLFIARQIATPDELADALVSAALSSSEETMFGRTLEAIAVDICAEQYGGLKSGIEGVDLEFARDGRRHIVSIKSGPNWGNSSQVKKMRADLRRAIATMRQHDRNVELRAVNGCCYGASPPRDYGDYIKLCGAEFWELISGDANLYRRLIPPIREAASNGFTEQRDSLLRRVRDELAQRWSDADGTLDWPRIVTGTSGVINE